MHWSIFHICLLAGLISSAVYFWFNRSNSEYRRIHKIVFAILLVTFLSEGLWNYLGGSSNDTFLLYNLLFVYLRVGAMMILFYFLPFSCAIQDKVLLSLGVFLGIGLANSLLFQPISEMIQSYTQLFGNGLVLFFSLIFFKDIIRQSRFKDINLLSLPYFWIATVALFSYGESFIFYFFSSLFFPSQLNNLGFIKLFVQFFAGLMFLIFGLAFYAPRFFAKNARVDS